jgi:antitoxin (DNA-binding transcriptional repressor) of toxin-antitoxin stability system
MYIHATIVTMEVPITQFRQKLFDYVNQALEGKEVWVRHKGRRVRIVPEHAPSKLSRITPMDIIPPGVDIEDDSWKAEIMREWEQNWDRQLAAMSKSVGRASTPIRAKARKVRRKP